MQCTGDMMCASSRATVLTMLNIRAAHADMISGAAVIAYTS